MIDVKAQPRVLVVDDELIQRKVVLQQLQKLGFIGEAVGSSAEALEVLQARDIDVVLLDVHLDQMSGLDVISLIKNVEDPPEVVMLTLDKTLESGVAAMRQGAFDYLTKPASLGQLEITIRNAADKRRLTRQNNSLRDLVAGGDRREMAVMEPIHSSPAMREIVEQAAAVARLNSTVLITGESGTGKDVLARYIHQMSSRPASSMVSVNCGAMPESLFESEFFGFEKGSFSGATATKRGLIEAADGSTLFLDEIGEMPQNLQVKLLRFLESGEFRRVGGIRDLFADTRIVAATNQDLTQSIRDGRFRSDLYYRLNVIHLHIPPLRQRPSDIPILIDHFIEHYRQQFGRPRLTFSEAALAKIQNYDFPGNVRELKNVVERAAALAPGDEIGADQIIIQKRHFENGHEDALPVLELPANPDASPAELDQVERKYILSVLNFTRGNRERAASVLGISERTLYRRLKDYD